jgi:hypothetical protein
MAWMGGPNQNLDWTWKSLHRGGPLLCLNKNHGWQCAKNKVLGRPVAQWLWAQIHHPSNPCGFQEKDMMVDKAIKMMNGLPRLTPPGTSLCSHGTTCLSLDPTSRFPSYWGCRGNYILDAYGWWPILSGFGVQRTILWGPSNMKSVASIFFGSA